VPDILGVHRATAIAGDPPQNIDFYAGVLGLRLVKQTVNYDDPTTYHLYYGDRQGHPGTIMTFLPWPGASRSHRHRPVDGHIFCGPRELTCLLERPLDRARNLSSGSEIRIR